MTRRRVLVIQPSLQPPGGGNGVAAWIIEALRIDHDVSLLTWADVDLAAVNRFFGTAIGAQDIQWIQLDGWLRRLVQASPVRADLLKWAVLMRHARTLARAFDVVLTADNEADFGRQGLQYVHYPRYLRPRPATDLCWYHVRPLLAP